jgi:hypothetical protein
VGGALVLPKKFARLSIFATLLRHIDREQGNTQEANMAFQFTTVQALKTFAGAAIFGLGIDAASLVSCHLTEALWFVLREAVGLVFWGVSAGWQASHAQVLGHNLLFLGCPLQMLHLLGSLAHFLASVV